MARTRTRYTDEFRASAVLMLQGAGYPDTVGSLAAVSARVGVAGTTLRRWFTKEQNPPPDKIVAIKKEDLVGLILHEAHAILRDMPDARQDASYREMATAFGIMVDKLQLLTGEPTSIHGWRQEAAAQGMNDADLFEAMVQELAARMATQEAET